VDPEQLFGERLRELRVAKGMNQTELADAAGVSQNGLSQWERGEREPSLAMAAKLAAALDVSLDELAGKVRRAADSPPPAKRKRK
jgi:transcriptional regulator with XRE-family HTH domain